MRDVGLARYEPALLPPCPTIRVLNYSNCQIHPLHFVVNFQKFSTLVLGFCSEASVHTPLITRSPKCDTKFLWSHVVMHLTLTLPGPSAGVSGSLDSYCSLKPLCSGMGEVVPARTSPTLLPPSPRTVLSLSCFKVLQCINCRNWHCKG